LYRFCIFYVSFCFFFKYKYVYHLSNNTNKHFIWKNQYCHYIQWQVFQCSSVLYTSEPNTEEYAQLYKFAYETTNKIKYALNKANIQLIDTAQFYENEKEFGLPICMFSYT